MIALETDFFIMPMLLRNILFNILFHFIFHESKLVFNRPCAEEHISTNIPTTANIIAKLTSQIFCAQYSFEFVGLQLVLYIARIKSVRGAVSH